MPRILLPLLLLSMILASQVAAAPVLSERGELTAGSPTLKSGEFHQAYKINLPAGVLASFTLTAQNFPPFLIIKTPDGRNFSRGVKGTERAVKLELITLSAGEYVVAVTTDQVGQRGKFEMEGTTRAIQGGVAGLKPLLQLMGAISNTDQDLGDGIRADEFSVEIKAGQAIRAVVESTAFDAFLVLKTPEGTQLRVDDVKGKDPEVVFLSSQSGPLKIMVLNADPQGRGSYRLQVLGGSLSGVAVTPTTPTPPKPPVASGVLTDQATLGPGSARLESGEWGKLYAVPLKAGETYELQIEAMGFQPRVLALLPDGQQVDQRGAAVGSRMTLRLTSAKAGMMQFCIASARVGQGGLVRVQGGKPTTATPPATPTTPTTPTPPATPGTEPKDPRVLVPPKFEGTKLVNLKDPAFNMPAPKPNPAVVKDPGILGKTLHQMNRVRVIVSAWSEMSEKNWIYPPTKYNGTSPRWFALDLENNFQDNQGSYTVPLKWSGNVFSSRHHFDLDPHGGVQAFDVTGTVSPDGDRVEWIVIRQYVQQAYWHEQDKAAYLAKREWKSASLVDLPLYTSFITANGTGYRNTTMQDLTKVGLEFELRKGFSYGVNENASAGRHVLDLGYLLLDPAHRNHRFIDPAQMHSVEYQSSIWSHPTNKPSISVFFSREKNVR